MMTPPTENVTEPAGIPDAELTVAVLTTLPPRLTVLGLAPNVSVSGVPTSTCLGSRNLASVQDTCRWAMHSD
jgi:hypothetical protein